MKAAVLTVSDRVSRGEADDVSGDLVGLVGDDAARDLVPVGGEELGERVAAPVGRLAARDAVGDGEDGGSHSLTFSTSSTLNDICLSTALTMS